MNAGGADHDYLDDDFELPESTVQELDDAATLSQRLPRRLVTNAAVDQTAHNGGQYQDETMALPPSSDYGFDDDDDVINLDAAPGLGFSQGVEAAQQPFAQPAAQPTTGHSANNGDQAAIDQLRSRMVEMERERADLQKQVDAVTSEATAKAGAIAILRSKHEKSTKEFERKLAVMQQLHADEIAKQKHELELTRKEQESTKTSNRFLEHDLAQEMEKTKKLNGTKLAQNPETAKAAALDDRQNYSDGFEHDEVMVLSPVKPRYKDKEVTPKLGRKRKRVADSSPAIPLDIEPPMDISVDNEPVQIEPERRQQEWESELSAQLRSRDESLGILRQVISHQSLDSPVRTLEELARYRFPDGAGQSVANMLLSYLSKASVDEHGSTAVAVCTICMKLWDRCLATQYYSPLVALLDLLQTMLFAVTISQQLPWTQQMVRLATKTVDLLAVPRALALRDAAAQEEVELQKRSALENMVDDDTALNLLRTMAYSAGTQHDTARDFWKAMEFDFVLLMMHKAQPMHQIMTMLQLLLTSVLPDSFGVLDATGKRQAAYQHDLLDRLTLLLFEDLVVSKDEPPYSRDEYADLRIQVLQAVRSISATDLGSKALAEHKTAMGRLIRFLHAQMMSLYDIPLSLGTEEDLHSRVIGSINLTTRIFYHLLREHTETISIRDKVAVIHGGWHKFLVAMSRIAFSERIAFEAGLDDEVVDAAHEILDAVLSPEEGEAIVMAVETPRTVGAGSRASMPVVVPDDDLDEVMT